MNTIANSNRVSQKISNAQFLDLEIGKKHQQQEESQSVVKCGSKRKYHDAFTDKVYDDHRYGQHIGQDFFKTNYGSNYSNLETLEEGEVFNPDKIKEITDSNGKQIDVNEVLSWCTYYLANKKIFQI